MDDLYNYIDKGGTIFSILLFFSAVGGTLIIYKFFEITFFIDFNFKSFENLLDKSHNIDDFKASIEVISDSQKKFLLMEFIEISKTDASKSIKEEQMEILLQKNFIKSQRFLPTLEIIAQVSPLIGLLGTVIGMIDSFNELELGGSLVDPSILAGGIWTALLTTAMGLIVAIPALISHYFFEKRLSTLVHFSNTFMLRMLGKI